MIDLLHPPREWFSRPAELKPGMGTTITDEGHVFGYLAMFNSRYINGGKGNTKPPRSRNGYAYANSFTTKAADGSDVATGVIAGDGGHKHGGDFKRTQDAYADTKQLLARVKYGEDMHGVWFSGAIWPKADKAAIEMLRSTGVSGHWERPQAGGSLELLASCTVNIPGFAQHRLCASATPTGGLILEPTADADGDTPVVPYAAGKAIPGGLQAGGGALTAAGGALQPISGVLAVLNSPTIDGRTIMDVDWHMTPLPLMYCNEQGYGHMGAKNVGSITEITIDGSMVRFEGFIDSALEKAAEAEIIANLGVLGISMDGYPEGDVEVVWSDDGWPENVIFQKLMIIGATLTTVPAFQETRGVVVEGGDTEVPASGEVDNETEARAEDSETVTAGESLEAAATFSADDALATLDEAAALLEADGEIDVAAVLALIMKAKSELQEEDEPAEEPEDDALEASGGLAGQALADKDAGNQTTANTTIRPPVVWL